MDMSDVSAKFQDIVSQIDALPKYVLYGSILIFCGIIMIITGLLML